jgi:hypothetical protein
MNDVVVIALLLVVFAAFGAFIWLCQAVRS